VEHLIGSIRRESVDHIIIFNESRTMSRRVIFSIITGQNISLNKNCPQPRRIQPPSAGEIVAFPEVGGLHHRYERRAA
jgi:putative transposase